MVMKKHSETPVKTKMPKIRGLVTVDKLDQRMTEVRNFRSFVDAIVDQCGGPDEVSLIKKGLIERYCMTCIVLSELDAHALTGKPFDQDTYAKIGALSLRLASTIGIDDRSVKKQSLSFLDKIKETT